MRPVSSWGRLSAAPHDVVELADRDGVGAALTGRAPGIAYGMGRSYGDECLNPDGPLWSTRGLDRLIAFDDATGRLRCEAGVVLRDIQRLMIPRGWSLPVVPGTQIATVGGAIANDVHGKNHHAAGTFGDHVTALRLVRTTGETIDCGPDKEAGRFAATVGGMGLTGLIAEAELQLKRTPGPWLTTEIVPFAGLDAFFRLSEDSVADWEHTVSWIDCTSGIEVRGLFLRARPAADGGGRRHRTRDRAVPFTPPVSVVNRLNLRSLNAAYYELGRRKPGVRIEHYEPFLYPLDGIGAWNRLYGPRGFYQYQCVVPFEPGPQAIRDMLGAIAEAREGSILAVLKTFGERRPPGLLSFVQPGITLALDFRNSPGVLGLFERLDAIVRAAGGRLYPAKDARMPREMFEAGYPRLPEFLPYRDPGMSSAMSRRLMGS
ncbi:MAG: FAD-binding oxidoreductase [Proteobacteria bacterium]|nr:FAD-binding oxidoreductase [Pseudomonadota bacterium]